MTKPKRIKYPKFQKEIDKVIREINEKVVRESSKLWGLSKEETSSLIEISSKILAHTYKYGKVPFIQFRKENDTSPGKEGGRERTNEPPIRLNFDS